MRKLLRERMMIRTRRIPMMTLTVVGVVITLFCSFFQKIEAQVSIPAKFDGFVYKKRPYTTGSVMIEAFFDPVCPDSRDSWPPLKQALDYYGSFASLVVHPFPLPSVLLLLLLFFFFFSSSLIKTYLISS